MGFVGLTLALVLADNNFEVIGFDNNERLITDLNKKTIMHEKGIERYIETNIGNTLLPVSSLDNVKADIHIISVGTPIDKNTLIPNIEHLKVASESIAKILKPMDLVILRSTVPVGSSRDIVLPILERGSGLIGSKDFFLAFCPERTIEGKALEELKSLPQIVGGLCKASTELASRLFNENTHTIVDVESLESAEMAKLMDNTFRDTIFAYSNQMALLAEKLDINLPDLIDRVNLGYDRNTIPKPSPGVGGPCLSKDPHILNSVYKKFNLSADLSLAARKINLDSIENIFSRSEKLFSSISKNIKNSKIFIMGFAFKGNPETNDLRDSTTIDFLNLLSSKNIKDIYGFDPVISNRELRSLNIKTCSIEEGFKGADAVFIMNNHKSFSMLPIFDLINTMNQPAILFDSWYVFKEDDISSKTNIIYSGVGIG